MNSIIITNIEHLITHLQNIKENKFKISVFKKILPKIKTLDIQITSGDHLYMLIPSGIGLGVIRRINEIIRTGKLKEVNYDLLSVKQLQQVHGIGPTKAKQFVDKYKIKNIHDFKQKVKDKQIHVTDNILLGLKYFNDSLLKIPRSEITATNKYLTKICSDIDLQFIITGSYRRGAKMSGDIDVLLYNPYIYSFKEESKLQKLCYTFLKKLVKNKFIVDSLTSIDQKSMKYMGYIDTSVINKKYNIIRRIDIRIVPYNSYFTAIMYFTGSASFNQYSRGIAKEKGFILNEYGLYPIDKHNKYTDVGFQINSEKDIFDRLDLEYLTPKERNRQF